MTYYLLGDLMEKILKYLKVAGYFLGSVIILAFISTIINFLTSASLGFINTFNTIVLLVIYFVIGFKQGKVSESKGWFCGLKNGLLLCFILLIISLIFFTKDIKLSTFLYYGILILSTIFGSIIGINKKKES